MFRFFIWKCVKSRTIKKVLIPSREAKFIFCSWHLCHHHYNYYYHPFKIETLKWKWNLFLFLFFYTNRRCFCLFIYPFSTGINDDGESFAFTSMRNSNRWALFLLNFCPFSNRRIAEISALIPKNWFLIL